MKYNNYQHRQDMEIRTIRIEAYLRATNQNEIMVEVYDYMQYKVINYLKEVSALENSLNEI